MTAPFNIHAFSGMNMLKSKNRFWANVDEGRVEPRVIIDADATTEGLLKKRTGYTLFVALPGAHSLWACEYCMLCVANDVLYKIVQGEAESLDDITGPKTRMNYELVGTDVYMSSLYWTGIYSTTTDSLSAWGIPVPPGPMISTSAGTLPVGTYFICMTTLSNGIVSGNSPVMKTELSTPSNITILNRPADAEVWITDTNGAVFYRVGQVDTIASIPTTEPLSTLLCGPPPNMEVLCYAFGRMWGFVGNKLYYSEPNRPDLFNITFNFFEFDSAGTLIARVPTGLFVGMQHKTVFLQGTSPEEMRQLPAGAGSIKGTLAYSNNLPELGDVLGTPEKGYVDVPIWRTKEGIVAGNTSGRLFNLTKHKLKLGSPAEGASLYRNLNGVFQFLTSAPSSVAVTDDEIQQLFKNGSIPVNNIIKKATTSNGSFSENVSCELWRNGVLITE